MPMHIRVIGLMLSVLVLTGATVALAGDVVVGEKAPDFELTDNHGKTHRLSDYEGRIVVLEWTNPECPFVQRHYSKGNTTMLDLQEDVAEHDVVWLAIDSSHFVTTESTAKWAEAKKIGYPILLDTTGEVGHAYGAKTTPHMFVIGPEGGLLYNGAIDSDPRGGAEESINYVAAALHEAMGGHAVSHASTKPYGCSVKYAPKASKAATASR
jgi:peroxiredoxin